MYFVCPIAYINAWQRLTVLTSALPIQIVDTHEASMAIPRLVVIFHRLFRYTIAD